MNIKSNTITTPKRIATVFTNGLPYINAVKSTLIATNEQSMTITAVLGFMISSHISTAIRAEIMW